MVIFSVFFVHSIPVFNNCPLFMDIPVVPHFFGLVHILYLFWGCSTVEHFVKFFIKFVTCLFKACIAINDWCSVEFFQCFLC